MASDNRTGEGALASVWTQVRIDLDRLHTGWMALLFARQRDPHPVQGKSRPESRVGRLAYRLWAALGVVVGLSYPLVVVGFAVRYYGWRLYRAAEALGATALFLGSLVVWGALTAVVSLRAFPTEGVVAVAAGGGVAAVAAVLALVFARRGGRATTALVAAPFGVTALLLPPVVAALYSPMLAAWLFPRSTLLAVWLLDGPLAVGGLATALRAQFDLVGLAYVGMWFGLAVPVGWALGLVAALAGFVRGGRATRE